MAVPLAWGCILVAVGSFVIVRGGEVVAEGSADGRGVWTSWGPYVRVAFDSVTALVGWLGCSGAVVAWLS